MTATAFELHPVDLSIIVAYALLMIGLGLYFGRKHDDATDYFLAGRRMIWPLIGISLFASNVSSTTLVGVAGDAYSTGISVFNYESMAAIVLIFGTFFFFPFLLRSGVYTNAGVPGATLQLQDSHLFLPTHPIPEYCRGHGRQSVRRGVGT